MTDILLTTLNARYWHSAFGLRYLMANMGDLATRTSMIEFGIKDSVADILESIIAADPSIVGIGVYIWNVEPITKLVADLKRVRPEIVIVLGGPEVSYETGDQPVVQVADYVITGEADVAFPELCQAILNDDIPEEKIISGSVSDLTTLQLPYDLYTEEDIAHRVIYVEVSRGCPFTCEFCLSALDIPVRMFDLDEFLTAMQSLLDQGTRKFKFVDRTFNLNIRVSSAILQFFLDRYREGLFLHFEMIPDRLPGELRTLIAQFPAGALQFEIGVQTFNDEVGRLISRRQNNQALEDNFRFLREETGVHIHADLIVGLPGESVESFREGFNRLLALDPQEIQVGILKRLKGTPIVRHDDEWDMRYSSSPPFEILSNRLIDFGTMQLLKKFARFWDLISNSGNFHRTKLLIWQDSDSAFDSFLKLTEWIGQREERSYAIPLKRLMQRLFEFLVEVQAIPEEQVAMSIWADYCSGGRTDKPLFLRHFELPPPHEICGETSATVGGTQRQARHQSKSLATE